MREGLVSQGAGHQRLAQDSSQSFQQATMRKCPGEEPRFPGEIPPCTGSQGLTPTIIRNAHREPIVHAVQNRRGRGDTGRWPETPSHFGVVECQVFALPEELAQSRGGFRREPAQTPAERLGFRILEEQCLVSGSQDTL